MTSSPQRKSTQRLLPLHHPPSSVGAYDLYPAFRLSSALITLGYEAVANIIARYRNVILDGYGGVFWETFRAQVDALLLQRGIQAKWQSIEAAYHAPEAIERIVAPFLGGDDPLFGKCFTGTLSDFFDPQKLHSLQPDLNYELNIIYGSGAALAGWDAPIIYLEVPKNEIQYRARAGSIANLGMEQPNDPKQMYKRFYFVDWQALDRHKAQLLSRLDWHVDSQREQPTLISGADFRAALTGLGQTAFRARPWFEPGPWGGQWLREHIPSLPSDVPNYAWSFELITPENGLLLESDGLLHEVAFDWLMLQEGEAVLGDHAATFGSAFPIRFDYLDTFSGGNLSVQCHPRLDYMRTHFGEAITQDETYYLVDCEPDARVYLGFQEGIDPVEFHQALELSQQTVSPLAVDTYVHSVSSTKHALYLIPNGTIHCAGANNLVLEISATPYIYTFKVYDWLRLDFDGQPRPLNIRRAFENVDFDRQAARIADEFIAIPQVLDKGDDWQVIHLPTHIEQFYDVHRLEFRESMTVQMDGSVHVLNLVAGTSILFEAETGEQQRYNFAETFVVPAAMGRYRLINEGDNTAKVIKAFLKKEYAHHRA